MRLMKKFFFPLFDDRSKLREYFTVLAVSVLFFLLVHFYLGHFQNINKIKWCNDSYTYLNVADWLFQGKNIESAWSSIANRPIFYPIILGISESIGPCFIIIMQSLLWLLTVLNVYKILNTRIKSRFQKLFLIIAFITLISPIAISFSVLTETVSIYLLSTAAIFLNRFYFESKSKYMFLSLLFLSLLAITKPSGLYIYAFALLYFIILKRFRLKSILISLLSAAPIIIQVVLIFSIFGAARISFISAFTFDQYLLTRVDALLQEKSITQVRTENNRFNSIMKDKSYRYLSDYSGLIKRELLRYVKEEPVTVLKAYIYSLMDNIFSGSDFVETNKRNPFFYFITFFQNCIFVFTACIGIIIILGFQVLLYFKTKRLCFLKKYILENFLVFTIIYIILTSGISYWQGDRFTLFCYSSITILVGLCINTLKKIKLEEDENCSLID
jgi:hypothetical protein